MEPLDDELEALLAEQMEGGGEEPESGHKRRLDLTSRADAARSLAGACRFGVPWPQPPLGSCQPLAGC